MITDEEMEKIIGKRSWGHSIHLYGYGYLSSGKSVMEAIKNGAFNYPKNIDYFWDSMTINVSFIELLKINERIPYPDPEVQKYIHPTTVINDNPIHVILINSLMSALAKEIDKNNMTFDQFTSLAKETIDIATNKAKDSNIPLDDVLELLNKTTQIVEEKYDKSIIQNTRQTKFEFDYAALLSKYDIKAIDGSIIKYYKAVQQWIDELTEQLDYYEETKESIIGDFNIIGLKLCKKYEDISQLSEQENAMLGNRQRFFASRFSLGMQSVKMKLLSIKRQADELEERIDDIDCGDNAIHELALIEQEKRASFSLIAENTAKIIINAVKKIEYFEANYQYAKWAVEEWEEWTDRYKMFRTTFREEMKSLCEEDGIEEAIWQKWYEGWQALRFKIEEKFQPVIEHELRKRIALAEKTDEVSVSQQLIAVLKRYRDSVDTFFREERKGIYQNFVFQANGDIQDKLETESRLYKLTADFQRNLQSIVFSCAKAEDRVFILKWASDLLDIQIDDVLSLVSDNNLDKVSESILTEFSELKKKNYEIFLADSKSYGEEQARRDKQFNSLLFKMRKGLASK